jgi:predicted GH43/DUF377 family glycosyl hydrolase
VSNSWCTEKVSDLADALRYCFAAWRIAAACRFFASALQNGIDGWQIDKELTLMSSPKEYPEVIWGIEDPRITFVPELQQDTWSPTPFPWRPGASLALI